MLAAEYVLNVLVLGHNVVPKRQRKFAISKIEPELCSDLLCRAFNAVFVCTRLCQAGIVCVVVVVLVVFWFCCVRVWVVSCHGLLWCRHTSGECGTKHFHYLKTFTPLEAQLTRRADACWVIPHREGFCDRLVDKVVVFFGCIWSIFSKWHGAKHILLGRRLRNPRGVRHIYIRQTPLVQDFQGLELTKFNGAQRFRTIFRVVSDAPFGFACCRQDPADFRRGRFCMKMIEFYPFEFRA